MAIPSLDLDDSKAKDTIRQVEFYFSESNLPVDRFLNQTVQESEDGLVSLALICSFTNMRKYLGLGEMKAEDVPEDTVLAGALAALDDRGGFLVKNHILTLEPLSDEAEDKYWKQLHDKQNRSKEVRGNKRERGGGRGFHGKRQHQDYSESPSKARKTTSDECC